MKKKVFFNLVWIVLLALFALAIDLPKEVLTKVGLGDSWFSKSTYHLGLDLLGGTELRYRIDLSEVPDTDQKQVVNGIVSVIEKRVNGLGVSEPLIQTSQIGDQRYVIVELPGVKDIQEAIKTVGKTVQLEFKEQRDTYTADELKEIQAQNSEQEKKAKDIFARVKKGEDFQSLAKQYSEGGNITGGGETEFMTKDQMDAKIADVAFKMKDGELYKDLIQTDSQFVILKTIAHSTKSTSTATDAKAKAHHVLIAYQGATKADPAVTRSKDDAKKLADEVLGKAKAKDADFGALAKQYSDDSGTKESGGDLGQFGKGTMVPEFEKAVFDGKAGDIVGPIETQFGFHIIKIDEVTKASTDEKSEPTVKLDEIIFTRQPEKPVDGWVKTKLTGKQFQHASVQLDPNNYTYEVSIQFNDEGKQLFADLTKKNLQKPIAIFLDNRLISAPTVQSEITSGTAVITGRFTTQEASDLARDLNTGAIPAPVILVGQTTVGATLGEDALHAGIKAGLIGLIILMLFMLVYYRLPGFVADMALIIYGLLVLMIFKLWPVTLTLAGIAGFILSLGMAVDANVLIFERLKEELRSGKTLATSVDEGFKRAWNAIRDSNVSSLITCVILWIFGTSIIRGFAVTLAIGILVSMFSAIFVTRTILHFFINPALREKHFLWSRSTFAKKDTPAVPVHQIEGKSISSGDGL